MSTDGNWDLWILETLKPGEAVRTSLEPGDMIVIEVIPGRRRAALYSDQEIKTVTALVVDQNLSRTSWSREPPNPGYNFDLLITLPDGSQSVEPYLSTTADKDIDLSEFKAQVSFVVTCVCSMAKTRFTAVSFLVLPGGRHHRLRHLAGEGSDPHL